MFVCHRYECLIPPQGATRGLRLVYFCGTDGDLPDGSNRPRVWHLPRYRDWPHDPVGSRGVHGVPTIYLLGSGRHAARHIGVYFT